MPGPDSISLTLIFKPKNSDLSTRYKYCQIRNTTWKHEPLPFALCTLFGTQTEHWYLLPHDSPESDVRFEDIQPELYSELGITIWNKYKLRVCSQLGIYYLQGKEKSNSLQTMLTTINVISQEEVINVTEISKKIHMRSGEHFQIQKSFMHK